MRILHLADRLTERGGAGLHLVGVLEGLAEGHQVRLAVGRDDGTVRAPCAVDLVAGLDERGAAPAALDPIATAFAPDVVHVHNVMNPVVLRWAAERGRALLTVQDHRYFCPTRGKWKTSGEACHEAMRPELCAGCFEDGPYFREVYALTEQRLEAARRLRVIVLSGYMKGELEAAGVPGDRIEVIPPFVHGLDPAALPDGPPCVLFAGRLVESKGVADAIAAWRASGVPFPLVLAGTGPLRGNALGADIEVLGWVQHRRLSRVYRRARAVLMPSRWQEPFGIVGLEALSFGVPVVAWRSGGIAEWHPGPLVSWGDVPGLARALGEAVGRRAAAPTGFDRASLMLRLQGVYEEVADGGR